MALRYLWRVVTGQAKILIKNYNVVDRAEKVLESEKRKVAPRHPGTETKFQVLIKGDRYPEDKKKTAELLDRLKIVKVTSVGPEEDPTTSTRSLPQEREIPKLSTYGFEEPKTISEGKCTLKQSLEFITKYQNDSESNSIESIAEAYKMKTADVENVVTHFRVFELYVSGDAKTGVAKTVLDSIGVNKVIKPLFRTKFAHLEKHAFPVEPKENKVKVEK